MDPYCEILNIFTKPKDIEIATKIINQYRSLDYPIDKVEILAQIFYQRTPNTEYLEALNQAQVKAQLSIQSPPYPEDTVYKTAVDYLEIQKDKAIDTFNNAHEKFQKYRDVLIENTVKINQMVEKFKTRLQRIEDEILQTYEPENLEPIFSNPDQAQRGQRIWLNPLDHSQGWFRKD
jgi:hypothetical protein